MPKDTIRIFRPTWNSDARAAGGKYSWYFLDHRGHRVPCRSGYEALFATYLAARKIPFEYEALALVVVRKALYIPDFFISGKGEFVELKGWSGSKTANQEKAIAVLRRKGFVIHVLQWEGLCKSIHSPYANYQSFFDAAKSKKQRVEDFIAHGTWMQLSPRPPQARRTRRKRAVLAGLGTFRRVRAGLKKTVSELTPTHNPLVVGLSPARLTITELR